VVNVKNKVAGLVLALGIAGGLMAAPASGAAQPNANGANCHGVVLSNGKADSGGLTISQFAKLIGASVKDIQSIIRSECAGPD
jgi:hypothetical protein